MIRVIMSCYSPEPGHVREEYAVKSLFSLIYQDLGPGLSAPEPLDFVAANDGPADAEFVQHLTGMVEYRAEWSGKGKASGGERVGIGGSLNRAIVENVWNSDLWLYTTDDWKLTQPYDLSQAVKLIRECGYDYVRLGPPHPNVYCQIKFQQGVGWWLELDAGGGGFAFATRPFVASRRFYDLIGRFREQCDSYVCERDYSDRVAAEYGRMLSIRPLRMAEVVVGSLEGPWEHIGEVNVGEKFP